MSFGDWKSQFQSIEAIVYMFYMFLNRPVYVSDLDFRSYQQPKIGLRNWI